MTKTPWFRKTTFDFRLSRSPYITSSNFYPRVVDILTYTCNQHFLYGNLQKSEEYCISTPSYLNFETTDRLTSSFWNSFLKFWQPKPTLKQWIIRESASGPKLLYAAIHNKPSASTLYRILILSIFNLVPYLLFRPFASTRPTQEIILWHIEAESYQLSFRYVFTVYSLELTQESPALKLICSDILISNKNSRELRGHLLVLCPRPRPVLL